MATLFLKEPFAAAFGEKKNITPKANDADHRMDISRALPTTSGIDAF